MAEPVSGDGAIGSAEAGGQQPGNVEESLKGAFESAGADGEGVKSGAKPVVGDTAEGGDAGDGEVKNAVSLAAWTEQIPAELRGNAVFAEKLARFPKVGDLAKAYFELEGKGPAIPGKDADAAAVAEFWEQAGKPKTAEGYSFAKDAEHAGGEFARASFAANLTAAQAEAMFKGLAEMGAGRLRAARDVQDAQLRETAAAMQKEYGPRYGEKIELLTRGLQAAGPNVASILAQAGLRGNPEIVKAFIAFGQMTQESGGARGGTAGGALQSVLEGASFEDFKT